ncbi:hypothetical protein ABZX38_25030 [Streptomyces longwoodensis]|uniref:hypothetical protein n=1 Tax=Streptomyces longwoodensis TaxID=68231 RepID=UPI0033AC8E16
MMRTAHSVLLSLAAVAGVAAAAAPAVAGGVLPVGNPSFGNTCMNRSGVFATASAATSAALTAGNVGQLPTDSPQQSCGGSDLAPAGALFNLLNSAH